MTFLETEALITKQHTKEEKFRAKSGPKEEAEEAANS